MQSNLKKLLAILIFLLAFISWLQADPAEVYFVFGSDTAIWNYGGTVDVYTQHPYYAQDMFTAPGGPAFQMMDPLLRHYFSDSYGQPLKMTWWMMAGNIYRAAVNINIPNPNLMTLYLMKKHHGNAILANGDELSLHYHTYIWSDYIGAGYFYWNQSHTFNDCREDFDVTVAQFLLDEEVFPVSFRSGWHYMDNGWQQRLDELLPFSMDNNWPAIAGWQPTQPAGNIQDWTMATSSFVPYHPSATNYQTPGDLPGWNVRSVKMQSLNQATVNSIFEQASNGIPQVACIWNHLPEYYAYYLTNTETFIAQAAQAHPNVKFRYCTAVEAMQRCMGQTNLPPPEIAVTESTIGDTLTLAIQTSKAIFQPQPFVAYRDVFQQYRVISGVSSGENRWSFTLPVPRNLLAKVGIAVTDTAGNLATRILRYLPDDVYLDNLDAQYTELEGSWTTYNNFVWNLDSRVAPLKANETARAAWALPVFWAGLHDLAVQLPYVPHMAQNMSFVVNSGNTALFSTNLAVKSSAWLPIGTIYLDPAQSNVLEMTVQGTPGATTYAVADVIKLSPHAAPDPDFISDVQIDAIDTTANILWTTPIPTTGSLSYGNNYGELFATNSQLTLNHVITLTGLSSGTNYYFNISSSVDGTAHTYSGYFRTTNYTYITGTVPVFGLNHTWKFTTANLDGVKWQTNSYDDSAWEGSGAGLFWADDNPNGTNPNVQPKTTPLPLSTNGYPYTTYYFRTHFELTNYPAGAALTLTNFIDDAAAFYLNGIEIRRYNLPVAPIAITNATLATAVSCNGDATCPVVFSVFGSVLTNLVVGDNVLAAEVHNASLNNEDVTLGTELFYRQPYTFVPRLNYLRTDNGVTFYWNGEGYRLQQSSQLNSQNSIWMDVSGAATVSPYTTSDTGTLFYRLQK